MRSSQYPEPGARHGNLNSAAPRVHLLIIQPTPFYKTEQLTDGSKISDETLDNLFRGLFASGWVGRKLDLRWGGGEPTVLDAEFYRNANRLLASHCPRDIEVKQSMRTNATRLDEDWRRYFRASRMRVGVSIDGPRRIHDSNHLMQAESRGFDQTLAGIRILRREQIPFHAVAVLSAESMRSAREIYEFFAQEGIQHVAFDLQDAAGDSPPPTGQEAWNAYRTFFAEFIALSGRDGRVRTVREWENGFRSIYQNAMISPGAMDKYPTRNIFVEPFGVVSVDHAGNVATYSPELLGAKNEIHGDYILGNVNTDDFATLARSPTLAAMRADIDGGVAQCRAQCAYFDICGGGWPANKIAENGTFASAATHFCRMTRMAIADLALGGPYSD